MVMWSEGERVQREIFAQYHVTDPNGFYSGQDFWTVPNDPTKPAASSARPMMRLIIRPTTPAAR